MAAICAFAWLYWRSASRQQSDNVRLEFAKQVGTTAISSERPRSVEAEEVRSAKGAEESAAAESTDSADSQLGPVPSAASSETEKLRSDANPQGMPVELDGISVPEGAPFPISESIEEVCASDDAQYFDCPELNWALKAIEHEQRDTQWAPSMESEIRAAVEAVPGLHIRALACRSTVCVVETDGELATLKTWHPLSSSSAGSRPTFGRTSTRGDGKISPRSGVQYSTSREAQFGIQDYLFEVERAPDEQCHAPRSGASVLTVQALPSNTSRACLRVP